LTSDLDSAVRARTGYQSLTCGEAPFSSVREESVPQDYVGTFLPTPVRASLIVIIVSVINIVIIVSVINVNNKPASAASREKLPLLLVFGRETAVLTLKITTLCFREPPKFNVKVWT
jgi:hypothetical protein